LRRMTPRTIGAYRERLDCLSHWMAEAGIEPENIDRSIMRRYVVETAGTVADETLAGRLRAWRRLFNFLAEDGLRDGPNPLDGVRIRCEHKVKSVVPPTAFDMVLSACDRKSWVGARNYALILLTFDAMLRLGEALSIRLADVEPRSGTLKVLGKGRKERVVAFSALTAKALHTYVSRFRVRMPGDLLFCTRTGTRIPRRHAHRIFDRAARKVGLRLNPHLARHSGATAFARSGGSIAVLQRALGHANLSTTQQYLHITGDDVHDAYARHAPAHGIRV